MDNPETSLNIINSHQVTGSCSLRTCYGPSLCHAVLMVSLQVVTTVSSLNQGLSQPKELPPRLPSWYIYPRQDLPFPFFEFKAFIARTCCPFISDIFESENSRRQGRGLIRKLLVQMAHLGAPSLPLLHSQVTGTSCFSEKSVASGYSLIKPLTSAETLANLPGLSHASLCFWEKMCRMCSLVTPCWLMTLEWQCGQLYLLF